MKRIITLILALIAVFTAAVPVMAANSGFVPSVSFGSSIIEIIGKEDGRDVIGYVEDANGNKLSTEYHDCLVVTSVLEAKRGDTVISKEACDLLIDTYEKLTADGAKLSEQVPVLNDIAKEAFGQSATADNLTVRDVYDFTALCEELNNYLETEGNTLTLKIKMPVDKDTFISVVTLYNSQWMPAQRVVNNNDGTISVTFTKLCPVLFVTGEYKHEKPPATGDDFNMPLWTALMLGSAACLTAIIVLTKRRPVSAKYK